MRTVPRLVACVQSSHEHVRCMDLHVCPLCDEAVEAWVLYARPRAGRTWRLLRDGQDLWKQQETGALILCSMCRGQTLGRERVRRAMQKMSAER